MLEPSQNRDERIRAIALAFLGIVIGFLMEQEAPYWQDVFGEYNRPIFGSLLVLAIISNLLLAGRFNLMSSLKLRIAIFTSTTTFYALILTTLLGTIIGCFIAVMVLLAAILSGLSASLTVSNKYLRIIPTVIVALLFTGLLLAIPPLPSQPRSDIPTPPLAATSADTIPGTILPARGTWRQGGLALQMQYSNVLASAIFMSFALTNVGPYDYALAYRLDHFSATDNLSNQLHITLPNCSYTPTAQANCNHRLLLKADSTHPLDFSCGSPSCRNIAVQVDTTNTSITEVIIKVSGIASIMDARWRIETAQSH